MPQDSRASSPRGGECADRAMDATPPANFLSCPPPPLKAIDPDEAMRLKARGNSAFARHDYSAAISLYSSALQLDGTQHHFYSNRALCYLRTQQWKLCISDARAALSLEEESVKAHYLLGRGLLAGGDLEEGLKKLRKASSLNCRQAKKDVSIEDNILSAIRYAKKLIWQRGDRIRRQRYRELYTFMSAASQAYARQAPERCSPQKRTEMLDLLEIALRDSVNEGSIDQAAFAPAHKTPRSLPSTSSGDSDGPELVDDPDGSLPAFLQPSAQPQTLDLPHWLCCTITMDLMKDPVLTQQGITYEREVLLQHFRANGAIDPYTNVRTDPKWIISNTALKNATEEFLDKKPWAFDESLLPSATTSSPRPGATSSPMRHDS